MHFMEEMHKWIMKTMLIPVSEFVDVNIHCQSDVDYIH
ncbi:hypothetical protein GLIP_4182 [Aliiglaciecola lipolytica E3]|uniref:Uncharacterized protein n=1 Tax=Aliiglaciecola lipolytica E3 TaxID=1127673 RepID=K6YJN4_9ALTE|nr:hypothetical protein GLIP_4182 [Aliiglaciecola lipolytica E3]